MFKPTPAAVSSRPQESCWCWGRHTRDLDVSAKRDARRQLKSPPQCSNVKIEKITASAPPLPILPAHTAGQVSCSVLCTHDCALEQMRFVLHYRKPHKICLGIISLGVWLVVTLKKLILKLQSKNNNRAALPFGLFFGEIALLAPPA